MEVGIRLESEPIRILDNTDFVPDVFTTIGGAGNGLTHPAHMIIIQNLTDADIAISDQTSPDYPTSMKYVIAARQGIVLDCTTNKTNMGGSFCYAQGTIFSAANLPNLVGPSTGSVYLSAIYAME